MTSKQNHLVFLSILIAGLLPRALHLLNSNYYILGTDSYLFHHLSTNPTPILANNGYPLHSGLTLPVRWLSMGIGVEAASILIPILINIVII